MTNQEAIERIKEHIAIHKYKESHSISIVEALEMAISALEKQDVSDTNVGDTINRQSAIDSVDSKKVSTNPERKKSKWIKKMFKKEKDKEYIAYTPYWYCPKCGTRYEPAVANTIINYCYNCGEDMRS